MTGFLNSWLVLSEQSHRKAFVIRGINLLVLALLVQGMVVSRVSAQDWPMWRYDSFRSASSDNTLPPELVEKWSLSHQQRRQAWDDPLNLDLMTYDRVFEPVVINGRVIVPYNDESKVVAYSLDDGSKLWTFFAEAPVRLSAAGFKDKVCFCSDDGYLYCVDVTSGRLLWKFFGGPNQQHALGNRRLVSAWPARGGPVIRDGNVYFSASIWPFMGVFIYALDLDTGSVVWVNDQVGSSYIKQPHSAPSFAGVAPQGAFVATKRHLIVPGGRSVPAVFDRSTGALKHFELNAGGKGNGGSFVAAEESRYFVHTRRNGTRAFSMKDGAKQNFTPNRPVLSDDLLFSAEEKSNQERVVRCYNKKDEVLWEIQADGSGDLIRASNELLAVGGDFLTRIKIAEGEKPSEVITELRVPKDSKRILVADQTLILITEDGTIKAYGSPESTNGSQANFAQEDQLNKDQGHVKNEESNVNVRDFLSHLRKTNQHQGYCLWFGGADRQELKQFILSSNYEQIAVIDSRNAVISDLRRWLDENSLHGRVTVHQSNSRDFRAPKYVANCVVFYDDLTKTTGIESLKPAYQSVRPYGGVLCLLGAKWGSQESSLISSEQFEQAKVVQQSYGLLITRVGKLSGSADWTHQHGDVANTIKSDDRRVKLPLGILWFGGSSHLDVLPRHGHGPPEQVVGGRLFIQGIDCLSARDVYTGRVLWKKTFDDLGTFDVYYDSTFEETPLNPKYNQVHIPGANGRGTNYVVTEDRVYIAAKDYCYVLDPATGEELLKIHLPNNSDESNKSKTGRENLQWGFIAVYRDVLISGLDFANYKEQLEIEYVGDKKLSRSRAGFGGKSIDRAASRALLGFDRYTGELLWEVPSKYSFWHNGIVAGGEQIYCLDRYPSRVEQALMRRGVKPPDSYRMAAIDYKSGELRWEINEGVFGTWLSYSEEFDLLLQAGAAASDRLTDEVSKGMSVHRGGDGSVKWQNDQLRYTGPCILHHDWIITNTNSYANSAGAFFLHDGHQKMVANPITGEQQPWKLTRAYGCNNIIASENMLTFRSGAAGYYDLLNEGGTGNFGGFKSGCTSNLVVANGILNAPDYTRTCSCAYQNQTSLGLVHMPEVDLWSVDDFAAQNSVPGSFQHLGINFGAPGDRRDTDGHLWLEYPVVAGASPELNVTWNEGVTIDRKHSSRNSDPKYPWVFASGLEGVTHLDLSLQSLQDDTTKGTIIPVLHKDDDAEENLSTGKVSLTSSDLEMMRDEDDQIVGLRFVDVPFDTLPDGPVYLQFTCDEVTNEKTELMIQVEAAGNPIRFQQTPHDLSSRKLIEDKVTWSVEPWKSSGERSLKQRSPDLRELLKTAMSRADWKRGNSIVFLIRGTGKRVANAFRGDSAASTALIFASAGQVVAREAKKTDPIPNYRVEVFITTANDTDESEIELTLQGKTIRAELGTGLESERKKQGIVTFPHVRLNQGLKMDVDVLSGNPLISGITFTRQGTSSGN